MDHRNRRSHAARRAPTWATRALTALSTLGLVVVTVSAPSTAAGAGSTEVVAVAPSDSPATIIANAGNVVPSGPSADLTYSTASGAPAQAPIRAGAPQGRVPSTDKD